MPSGQKKIIHFGFVSPSTPEQIVGEDLAKLDATCPFDGIGINPVIKLTRDGKTFDYHPLHHVGSPYLLTKEDLGELIPMFRRFQATRLKHNFFVLNSSPFNGDWFDDDAWKRTLNNFGMLAWAAKESGFAGLCLDIEPYALTSTEVPQETLWEVIDKLEALNPELKKYHYPLDTEIRQFKHTLDGAIQFDPQKNSKTGLMIAFFNGVYDGASDTMTIVDGNEGAGYHAASEEDYAKITGRYHRFADSWIDKTNHEKFWKITSMGVSFYLDSYVKRDKPGRYDLFAKSDNPTQLLATNVGHALDYSDEYVWFWCEKGNFWPGIFKSNYPFWGDLLPHCVEAIEAGRNMRVWMDKYASGANLLKNGGLEPADEGANQKNGIVKSWATWQAEDTPKGTFSNDNGRLRLVNVTNGGIAQAISGIKADRQFILRARCKNESHFATPVLSYFFRDNPDTGVWGQRSIAFTEDDADGWKRATFHITVPKGHNIATINVFVGVLGFQDPTGRDKGCLFDDIDLQEVVFPWTRK